MITFFTHARPFEGLAGIIQRNAITSWTKLKPKCEIVLLGSVEGADKISEELGLKHIPDVSYGNYGKKPFLPELFEKAERDASHNFMCFINADIILTDDFMKAFSYLMPLKKKWVMVGRRRNIVLEKELDFKDSRAIEEIKEIAIKENRIAGPWWIDYFLYTKGIFTNIPPFILGAWRWDNWLINKALSKRVMVIDASDVVTAIHQDHDPPGYEKTKYALDRREEEYLKNEELYKEYAIFNYSSLGAISAATYFLTTSGIKKKKISFKGSVKRLLIFEPYRRSYIRILSRKSYIILEKMLLFLKKLHFKRII